MKNQYIGDIGDYGKYGLLRSLLRQNIKIGVNWYLTPKDGSTDGRFREYLERVAYREYDAEVFDEMSRLDSIPDKNIEMIERSGQFDQMVFYHSLLDTDSIDVSLRSVERESWHQRALQKLKDVDLVFADPDMGLGIGKRASYNNSQRYVFPDEVADYFNRGQDVFYYQHRDRKSEEVRLQEKTYMKEKLPSAGLLAVSAHKWTMRAYIFVVHRERKHLYKKAIAVFLKSAWGTLKTDRKLFFTAESV